MTQPAQSYENHGKLVPGYHYVGTLLLLVSLLYFGFLTFRAFSVERLMFMLVLLLIGIVAFYTRTFALGVQDRVIRLEERLRMERLLPEDLKGRISEITTEQIIGLRFASDGELEGLVRKALAGELTDRKSIKQAIQSWRADHQRV